MLPCYLKILNNVMSFAPLNEIKQNLNRKIVYFRSTWNWRDLIGDVKQLHGRNDLKKRSNSHQLWGTHVFWMKRLAVQGILPIFNLQFPVRWRGWIIQIRKIRFFNGNWRVHDDRPHMAHGLPVLGVLIVVVKFVTCATCFFRLKFHWPSRQHAVHK
jgi:hypothetical protein